MCGTELAWAAGFFDGEGSTKLDRRGPRAYISIQIGHVEPEPLRRFAAAVGVGNVTGPYDHNSKKNPRWKPHYSYQAYGENARFVIERQLWTYLSGPKRQQWIEKINDDAARTGRMSSSAASNN